MGRRSAPAAFVLGGSVCGLHACRSLGRRGVPVVLFERGHADMAYASRYVEVRALPAEAPDEAVLEAILAESRRRDDRPPLLLMSDAMLRLVSRHRAALVDSCRLLLPEAERVDTVLDKIRFADFTARHGIPAPATLVPDSPDELASRSAALAYPVVLKPVESSQWSAPAFRAAFGPIKAVRAASADEALRAFSRLRDPGGPLLVQEEIPGRDDRNYSYVNHRRSDGSFGVGLTVRKHRIYPIHAGVGSALEGVEDEEIDALGRRVVEALGYLGVSSVCVKRDARTGEAKVYEVNGRFPMPHPVLQLCGVDFPYLVYRDLLGEETDWPRPRATGKICIGALNDLRAALDYRSAGELTFLDWLRTLSRTRLVMEFALDDPLPLLAALHRGSLKVVGRA